MDYLVDSDDHSITTHSSVDQYINFLGVMKDGMYVPIIFDQLDGISCGKVYSHPIMIYFGEWVGYNFPVAEYTESQEVFIIGENEGEKLELLPQTFGRGDCWHNTFYDRKYDDTGILIGDDGVAVGYNQQQKHLVGLDYLLADDCLEPAD